MMPKRRNFRRSSGYLKYRKLFVLAVEGAKTEPQYFAIFNDLNLLIQVTCLKSGNESSPPQILKRMADHLKREALKVSDEAWLVVDKDQWTNEQLHKLYVWSQSRDNYGFALSNPRFEYWLLLHFEDGTGIGSSRECSERLKRYLPEYDKNVDLRKITRAMIDMAVSRARARDNPPCPDWPRTPGGTTVYRLIDRIIKAGTSSG
jgi:hypothetical protein